MKKIDRLGWAAGISFVTYGARIGIRMNDPAVLELLPPHLPPGWKSAKSSVVDYLYSLRVGGNGTRPGIQYFHLLYAGAERLARTTDLDEVFAQLESALHFNVAIGARRKLFVHAGVVSWRGQAIVIPGRSGSGKTELVAALVRAGAIYYSDEYAVFDAHGRVHPYPKPLSLRQENGGRPEKCAVETLGGRPGANPLPVGMIVVSKYQPGARWQPRLLSPAQAMLALLDNTVMARYKPEVALATLHRVALGARTLKGKRGEARDFVATLLDT